MPPEGYKTVTVPTHVYDALGDYSERKGLLSRTQAIQYLLDDADSAGDTPAQPQVDDAEIETRVERAGENALPEGAR